VGRSSVEYATDQITVYKSCPYGCIYCFWKVPLMRSRLQRIEPRPVQEAMMYARSKRRRVIVISFTTDPYPPCEAYKRLTRRVLEVLSKAPQHRILILTKNPGLALRDLDLMHIHGDIWLGTTLTCLHDSSFLEPRAPPAQRRLEALREAHGEGVKTWVSIEPIIPPFTNVKEIVVASHGFVDFYVLGAFNYARQLGLPEPSKREYLKVLAPGLLTLEKLGKRFFIKRELRSLFPYLPAGQDLKAASR